MPKHVSHSVSSRRLLPQRAKIIHIHIPIKVCMCICIENDLSYYLALLPILIVVMNGLANTNEIDDVFSKNIIKI